MNGAFPEMLHCLQTPENLAGNGTDVTVLERQRARLKWQQQQEQQSNNERFFTDTHLNLLSFPQTQQFPAFETDNSGRMSELLALRELVTQSVKNDPGLENGWPDFTKYHPTLKCDYKEDPSFVSGGFVSDAMSSRGLDYGLSRTTSCPATVGSVQMEEKTGAPVTPEKMVYQVGKENFKKRKADKAPNSKISIADDTKDKRIKGDTEERDSKATEQNNQNNSNSNRETSADTSKENSKISEVQKPDYIHVRARRGQATDSHSLAERVRREKISERMKYLQDLVPGCNKITGKAGMLDEIINYVQSLQRQVEFLSMKLAAVNPRFDFNIDNFFTKELLSPRNSSFPAIGMSSELANPPFLPFNPLQQVVSCSGLDMAINVPEMTLQRTLSAPVSLPDPFIDSCFHGPGSSSTWDTDFQSLYNVEFHQGRPSAFPSQPFTGNLEANNLKMEM